MSFYPQMDGASSAQLQLWWNGEAPEWADLRESFLQEVAYKLSESGEQGIEFLKSYARDGDVEKRLAAIYFLADRRFVDDDILDTLREAFDADDSRLKTAALWGAIDIGRFLFERDEIEPLLHQPDGRLAALAMVYLSHAHPDETVEILRRALSSSNPHQRSYACDQIGDRFIAELKEEMTPLLNDAHDDVRQAARSNLKML